jgi:2-methylcitrate dehydratase PrpD
MFQEGTYVEAKIEVVMNNGRRLEKSIKFPKGHPKNRFSYAEYTDLFRRAASFTLKKDKIDQVIEKVQNLELIEDLSELTELMHN